MTEDEKRRYQPEENTVSGSSGQFTSSHSSKMKVEPPRGMVVITILAVIAWSIFILFYALYWSTGFSTFQNIIVTLVSLFITGLSIGLMWVIAGPKYSWRPN